MPDLVRMLRRIATDPDLPIGLRVRLWMLLGYLLSPIDLVPDIVPVMGYVDDVIVAIWALRWILNRLGTSAVSERWPGDAVGLETVLRFAGGPA